MNISSSRMAKQAHSNVLMALSSLNSNAYPKSFSSVPMWQCAWVANPFHPSVIKMCQGQLFAGQQHVRLESPASSRHWGAWCPQPCKRNPLQLTHILSSNSPPAEDTLIPLHPTQTPAGPGTLAASETRSLSTSLKSVRRGAKCTEFTDVFNLLHVLHCKRSALHCAALIWTLNCMSATWSIRAR